jgi:sec-independent protein translocase protein TatA
MLRDLSLAHILILLLIVVLVFGAKRLPEIGSSLGKGIREFKRSLNEIGDSGDDRPALPPTEQRTASPERGEPKRLSD